MCPQVGLLSPDELGFCTATNVVVQGVPKSRAIKYTKYPTARITTNRPPTDFLGNFILGRVPLSDLSQRTRSNSSFADQTIATTNPNTPTIGKTKISTKVTIKRVAFAGKLDDLGSELSVIICIPLVLLTTIHSRGTLVLAAMQVFIHAIGIRAYSPQQCSIW